MMPTFPLPSLKFRTVGFPQYGFKASLSGASLPTRSRRTESADTRPVRRTRDSFVITLRMRPLPTADQALSPGQVERFYVPLCERPCLSTPGVLGSRSSSVVSRAHGLLRPHPSVPQARDDFTALPLIRRAFAVRVRLGDPRDLPYFRYRAFQACRRPYAGGFDVLSRCSCAPRCQASSLCPRVATHEIPPLPAILGGDTFRRGIVRFMLRPVWFALALLTGSGGMRHVCATGPSETLSLPLLSSARHRAALGIRLDGRTGNLPSSGLAPDQLRQLVRLHDKVVLSGRPSRGRLQLCLRRIKRLGAGQMYLISIRDKDGNGLDGSQTYRLMVPPNAPVEQDRFVTLYDRQTHALIKHMDHGVAPREFPRCRRTLTD